MTKMLPVVDDILKVFQGQFHEFLDWFWITFDEINRDMTYFFEQ